MDCNLCNDLLSRRVVENLKPDEVEALSAHLQGCGSCAAKSEELEQLGVDLRGLSDRMERQVVPFTFDPQVVVSRRPIPNPWARFFGRGSLAAAAVIALLFLLVDRSDESSRDVPAVVGVTEVEPAPFASRQFRTPSVWIDRTPSAVGPPVYRSRKLRSPTFARPVSVGFDSVAHLGTPSITVGSALRRMKHARIFDDGKADLDHGFVAPGDERSMGRVIRERRPA